MNGSPNLPAVDSAAPCAVATATSVARPAAGDLNIIPGACAFGLPLANVEVPCCPIKPVEVDNADIYADAVVIYAGNQPVISIDPASAVKFAEKVLEVYRARMN